MPEEERGDLLGECDLIMSFLCYNDISAMSRLHRSASAQMSRPAISIRNSGGWTFGSPSVLMMFYRAPGKLASELAGDGRVHAALLQDHRRSRTGARRRSCGRRRCFAGDASPMPISNWSAPMPRSGTTGRRTWRFAAIFWRGGFLCCAEVEPELTLEERRRRCCGCTTPRGSTSGTPQPRIIMRCGASRRGYRSCLRSTGFPRSISLRRASP